MKIAVLDAATETKELLCGSPDEGVPEALRAVGRRYAPELEILLKTPARAETLAEAALSDKKRTGEGQPLVLVEGIGRCRIETVPQEELSGWFRDGGAL